MSKTTKAPYYPKCSKCGEALKSMNKNEPIEPEQASCAPADGSACPVCGEKTRLKLSGRGKHFVHICPQHGFVRITRHPLNPPPPPKRGVLQWLRDWLLGPHSDSSSATGGSDHE